MAISHKKFKNNEFQYILIFKKLKVKLFLKWFYINLFANTWHVNDYAHSLFIPFPHPNFISMDTERIN